MKQLLWKEWYELRFLPIGAAILCFILQFGYYVMCLFRIGGETPENFDLDGTQMLLWVLWSFFAILAGSGLISQEIGTGTLSFLFALPTNRRQIWLCKVVNGAVAVALCVISSAIVTMILDAITLRPLQNVQDSLLSILYGSDAADGLLCAFGCFAVSIAISPLLDRNISAASVSVGACLVLLIFIAMGTSYYDYLPNSSSDHLQSRMAFAIAWLCIPAFTAISYWTFTHGETLRSAKRFYAAGRAAVVCLLAFVVLFFFARSYVLAQSGYNEELQTPATTATLPQQGPSPGSLYISRETDGLGHEQYFVQLPSQQTNLRLVINTVVDGNKIGGSGSLVTGPTLRIGAWLDYSDDGMVKAVLRAQGITVAHPDDITLSLHTSGTSDSVESVTLHFKNGNGWSSASNGLPIDADTPYRVGENLTILDAILITGGAKGIPTDLKHVPNDASSKALFASGMAHRVSVTATFEPAK